MRACTKNTTTMMQTTAAFSATGHHGATSAHRAPVKPALSLAHSRQSSRRARTAQRSEKTIAAAVNNLDRITPTFPLL